jgi:uncharacterized protein (TIGR02302 family)
LALARASLLWERTWSALWPVTGILCLFLAVAMFDVLPLTPGWLHLAVLLCFASALLFTGWRALRRLAIPDTEQARRKLERDSKLSHRPFAALNDRLATNSRDSAAVMLWEEHRRRLLAQLAHLRVRLPRAGLARVDPFAIRAAVFLVLFTAIIGARHDWSQRLADAFTPRLTVAAAAPAPSVDLWINPPAYTGQPPLFLDPASEGAKPLEVPTGSTVLAQVQGGKEPPILNVGDTRAEFTELTAGAFKVSAKVESGERLTVEQGGMPLAEWTLTVLPDRPPHIEFISPPSRSERSALRLEYGANDDYGLSSVTATISRSDKPESEPIEIALPLPGIGVKQAKNASYHDLTPHPWAGLAVDIRLIATDALGQQGKSETVRTVLPERIFNHPVARLLVELRKRLTLEPEERLSIVRSLQEISGYPEHFFHDLVVALALRSAERRLIHDSSRKAVGEVQQLLWDTALRIEEGELAVAERELREIQEALKEALARNAPDEEIERLMDDLQQAMDRFLEAMAERLQEQLAEGVEPEPLPPNAQLLQRENLQDMLDMARELARSGARDAARDLLAQLQEMLENLRANPFAQQMDEAGRNAWEMMREMEGMMQRQQQLLDRSFQRSQRESGNQSQQGMQQENRSDAQGQESLRRSLGEMLRRLGEALGEIPRPLGRAEQAMREARDALARDAPGEAVDPQSRALDQLQQGMQAMAEQFMQQFGESTGRRGGQMGMSPGENSDPLGRGTGNMGLEALEGVEIPDEMELKRAQEVLRELRHRAGQRSRPRLELDYIDRLLQQF